MALEVFLKSPFYGSDGYYRRVEDNPHQIDLELSELPSTAEVRTTGGKREKVWMLRGETDPAHRAETALREAEANKVLPLAKALRGPQPDAEPDPRIAELEAQLKATNEALAAIQAQLAKAAEEPAKEPIKVPSAADKK
jgi:hypothetical protein